MQVPTVGVLDVGHKPLTPQGGVLYLWDCSHGGSPCWGWGFWQACISASPTHLMWPFYPVLWGSCSASSRVLFRGSCSIYSCKFLVSVGGDEVRIFLHHHLELLPILRKWFGNRSKDPRFVPWMTRWTGYHFPDVKSNEFNRPDCNGSRLCDRHHTLQ